MRISYWSSDVCSSDLARHEQWIFQVRAIDHVRNRQQTIEIDRAIDLEHVIGGQLSNVGRVLPHLFRAIVRDIKPHDVAQLPLRELALESLPQILGLLSVDTPPHLRRPCRTQSASAQTELVRVDSEGL